MDSGALIRAARMRAQLSQTELARRAGVAQSVISAYESNRREPGLRMLSRLIEATGHKLVVEMKADGALRRGLPDSRLGRRLRHQRRALIDAAAQRGAHNLRVFGSVARGEDDDESDVDLLADLDANVGIVSLAGIERALSELLGVDVDVVPTGALKPTLREHVHAEAIPL